MSDRLTPEWTTTLDEAFGETGVKGRLGEEFVAQTLRDWGYEVTLHTHDRSLQVAGIDITFKKSNWYKSYTADVKHNINDSNSFTVETSPEGWLFNENKISDRVWHCNADRGLMAWYGRPEMQKFIQGLTLRTDIELVYVSPYGVYERNTRIAETPSFISFRKVPIPASDK